MSQAPTTRTAPRVLRRVTRTVPAAVAAAAAAVDEPDAFATASIPLADEPVLDMDAIQGNVIPGFGSAHLELVGLRIDTGRAGDARVWLRDLAPLITTAAHAWHAREVRRAVARSTGTAPPREGVFLNVLLSHEGASLLGLPTAGIHEGLFRSGMAHADLQDPTDANGRPVGWKMGDTQETTPHLLLLLGADDLPALAEALDVLIEHLPLSGMAVMYRDTGHQLPGDIEHFGFRDGIAQPGVRGRRNAHPDSFVTRRYIPPEDPQAERFSRPGEPLIWPGHFILGYPTQDELTEGPGPIARPPEPWMANGSFAVFRRLRQDVAAFRRFADGQAAAVSTALGREVTAAKIQAWLVGRWPNGEPLVRQPAPTAVLAEAPMTLANLALNHFDYADAVPDVEVDLPDGRARIPGVAGDPAGARCPHFAHIRKVNLRDKLTDQGSSFRFRMLRRGIPFGPLFRPAETGEVDRGLLFLAYQRDLQPFLTVSTTWMNNPSAPEGFGHDLLVGQHRRGRSAERHDPKGHVTLDAPAGASWITPTGGGFFFSPAVSVFANLT
jgi:Dyp-type peroxidase family